MLAVLFVFIVWTAFSSGTSSLESNNDFKYTCNMTKEYLNDLEKLIQKYTAGALWFWLIVKALIELLYFYFTQGP